MNVRPPLTSAIVTVTGLPPTAVPPIDTPIVAGPFVFGAVYVAVQTPLVQPKIPSVPALAVAVNAFAVTPGTSCPNASRTVTVATSVPLTNTEVADSVSIVCGALAAPLLIVTVAPVHALRVATHVAHSAITTRTRWNAKGALGRLHKSTTFPQRLGGV